MYLKKLDVIARQLKEFSEKPPEELLLSGAIRVRIREMIREEIVTTTVKYLQSCEILYGKLDIDLCEISSFRPDFLKDDVAWYVHMHETVNEEIIVNDDLMCEEYVLAVRRAFLLLFSQHRVYQQLKNEQ